MKKILLYTVFGFTLSITEAFAEKYCNSAKTCIWESDGQGNVIVTGTGTLESLQGRSADEPIKTVNINGVSSIGRDAFRNYGTLTDVTIGESVEKIGEYAFLSSSITNADLNVMIKSNKVSVGSGTFQNGQNINYKTVTYLCGTDCYATLDKDGNATYFGTGETVLSRGSVAGFNVVTADIGNGISEIARSAFQAYKNLTDVTIGESVEKIGQYAFAQNGGTVVTIKGDNVSIADYSFNGPKVVAYNSISYSCGTGCYATLTSDGHVIYSGDGEGTLSFGRPAGGFTVIAADIEEGITSIADQVFWNYKTFTDVILGESIQNIGSGAFANAFASQKEVYCPKALEEVCRSKIGSFAGTYSEKGKYILYYDSTGKLVKKGPNPGYKSKKIYTVEEAMEATKDGERFHVYLTYK